MALGYRSLFRINPDQDPITFIENHLGEWLDEKKNDSRSSVKESRWDGPGVYELGESAELRVVHKSVEDPATEYRLYRLAEGNPGKKYVVSIYVVSRPSGDPSKPNIAIEVEDPSADTSTAILHTATPRIAARILDSAEVTDNWAPITGSPIRIDRRNSALLIDAITDPKRTVSVIAAGSLSLDTDDQWEKIVKNVTRQSVGLAAIFSVDDDVIDEIDDELGVTHAIGRGRFRTYAPHVDLKNPDDSLRHRWLAPTTLSRSLNRDLNVSTSLQYSHAAAGRKRLIELEVSNTITVAKALLKREERAMVRASIAERDVAEAEISILDEFLPDAQVEIAIEPDPQRVTEVVEETELKESVKPAPADEKAEKVSLSDSILIRLKKLFSKWLPRRATDPVTTESLIEFENYIVSMNSQLKTAQEQIAELEEENEILELEIASERTRADDYQLQLALDAQEAVQRDRELNDLWRRIQRADLKPTNVAAVDKNWTTPGSMVELVNLLTPGVKVHEEATKYVVFTGKTEGAEQIDERYTVGRYNDQIWQYVRTLYSYARLKKQGEFKGSFQMYLNSPMTDGEKVPLKHYAAGESSSVKNRREWREMRMLPVPKAVDPSGYAYMEAHFKPSRSDAFAPRVHFYDDTAGSTGKIYIGYVGRHLDNTQTSNT